jgi:segregation and condensation protein B
MNSSTPHARNDLALAEAALFLSPHPVSRRALARVLGDVALPYIDQLLEDLAELFRDPRRGLELHIEDGRALLRVKAAYVNDVAHLAPQQDIPRPILRSLAVIAYNHPMTQSDLVKVRGNKAYNHVQELIERRLITGEEHGRTRLLRVTKEFLRHFGLSTVEEFRFHYAGEAAPEDAREESSQVGVENPSETRSEEASETSSDVTTREENDEKEA